ncbi:Holliday junction ATP-dependent DNA helicase RuvA [Spiroplasma taiwanense]|uniref:hypothetical protein n=1 Tax=Spiroplasma taiwanense TaxID=2145 RepID=UPI00041A7468|nr:hypothetical protein [Spiroplasma taiwanense]
MYYLKAKVIWQNENDLVVETNNIGYRGKKIFNENLEIEKEYKLYLITYHNDFIHQLLFFSDKKVRNLAKILLNIKNIGILTIIKIFKNLNIDEFLIICKEQNINSIMIKTRISEGLSKKIVQEIRNRIFN